MSEAVIQGIGVCKSFGAIKAVDHVDITVGAGSVVGIIGPDGAGKTTLLRMLAGVVRGDSGQIRVPGRLGYVPQAFSLYQDMSLDENLDFFGTMYGLMGEGLKAKKDMVLDFVGLKGFRDRLAGQLSGGMKQRLALAVALVHDPEVILMDEPTNGVDPVARKELWRVVRELASRGSGALVSTQYLEEGELCDAVALMAHGRIVAYGTPGELKALLPVGVWQAGVGPGADRFVLSEALAAVAGVGHIRRQGAWVRFFADPSLDAPAIRAGLDAVGVGECGLDACAPSIQDTYAWLTMEGGAARG